MNRVQRYGVAIGAGFVSALLFAVGAQTSALAMALAYLAPLPLMIATFGWGLDAGAAGAALAALVLAGLLDAMSALLFASTVALPGWAMAGFANAPFGGFRRAAQPGAAPFAPVGAIVVAAAAFGAATSLAALVAMVLVYGGYAAGAKAVAVELEGVFARAFESGGPEGLSASDFAATVVRLAPAAIAGSSAAMLCANLYAAARSMALSQGLKRPWPDIPHSLVLPWPFAVALIVCLAGAFALPTPADQVALVGVGALGAAFAMQGLATAHDLSRGLALRPAMLFAIYVVALLRMKWALPVVALIGVAESFVRLRGRAGPPPSNPQPRIRT